MYDIEDEKQEEKKELTPFEKQTKEIDDDEDTEEMRFEW